MDNYKRDVFAPYSLTLHLLAENIDDSPIIVEGSDSEPDQDKDDDFWTYDRALIASFAEVDARFSALRVWRSDVASKNAWSAWVVFSDKQLIALADANPSTLDELGNVPGISAKKVSSYGQDILNILGGRTPSSSL